MLTLTKVVLSNVATRSGETKVVPAATRLKRRTVGLLSIALVLSVAVLPTEAVAGENDAVRIWNQRAVETLANGTGASPAGAGFPPTVAFIQFAIVQTAVYDAVNAIKGGHQPYLPGLKAPTSASKGAAAATAAYLVLLNLINDAPTISGPVKATIMNRLETQYQGSMSEIPDGEAKQKGIEVGEAAAAAILDNRAGDGRFGQPAFFPVVGGGAVGIWQPVPPLVAPNFGNDPSGWVRNVRPFALPSQDFFQTTGPWAIGSAGYAQDFNEVKLMGRSTNSGRSLDQTRLAQWSSGHPLPMIFSAMRQVSEAKGLTMAEEARFYAMTSVTGADSVINCFSQKAYWNFWRPTTAIREADGDGNPQTASEAGWTSLLNVPPYPEEPSGANCLFAGVMHSAKAFFGNDNASFDITNQGPGPGTGFSRPYSRFTEVIPEMIDARVFGGLHFRRADVNGADLGRRIAEYVDANLFNCGPPGQCRQERLH